jgi:hypothetical protein
MSYLPIEQVRGEHLVDRAQAAQFPKELKLVDPTTIAALAKVPVSSVTFRMLDGQPVAEVETGDRVLVFDGTTGVSRAPIDDATAIRIARSGWKGETKPDAIVSRVTQENPEYRGPLPAWRVQFSDPDNTSVFVTTATGKIAGVRTGTWRLYDFFWSLHIMDWKNHEDFNTPGLLAFAVGGWLLGLAGTILLIMRWPLRRAKSGT